MKNAVDPQELFRCLLLEDGRIRLWREYCDSSVLLEAVAGAEETTPA